MFTYNDYFVGLSHDNGTAHIKTTASSINAAKTVIKNAEGCPDSAINAVYTFANLTGRKLYTIDVLHFEALDVESYKIFYEIENQEDNQHFIYLHRGAKMPDTIESVAKWFIDNADYTSICSPDVYTFQDNDGNQVSFVGCDIMDFLPSAS